MSALLWVAGVTIGVLVVVLTFLSLAVVREYERGVVFRIAMPARCTGRARGG